MSDSVLVSGAEGFIGQHVYDHLQALGMKVDGVRANGSVPLGEFDYIVNLAARTSIPHSLQYPREAMQANLNVTLGLLEKARRYPPRLFVHLSTEEMLSETGNGDYEPRSPYAASKIMQETACLTYQRCYGVRLAILTADIVVGPGQAPHKVVPTMTRAILAGEPVPVFTDAHDVPHVRRYAGVTGLCQCIAALCNPENAGEVRTETYYNPPTLELDNKALAREIGAILGRPVRVELVHRPEVRPVNQNMRYGYRLSGAWWVSASSYWRDLEAQVKGLATG